MAVIGASVNRLTGRPAFPVFGPGDGGAPGGVTTWNPADKQATIVLSNGNRKMTAGTSAGSVRGTTSKAFASGKWHFEVTLDALDGAISPVFGLAASSFPLTDSPTGAGVQFSGALAGSDGFIYVRGTYQGVAIPTVAGDVVAVELDADNQMMYLQKAGSSRLGPFNLSATTSPWFPCAYAAASSGASCTINTGQAAFAITPTSGYLAWG